MLKGKPAIIEKLPKLKVRQVLQVWMNCVEILADKDKKRQHDHARMVIRAINKEWARRRREPLKDDDYFDWPSTDAAKGRGTISTQGWLQEGALGFLGYKVGADGLRLNVRQRILDEVFVGEIPPAFPPRYLDEWGLPGSTLRLKKMAESIASFVRNGKRRGSHMTTAIKHWEEDLDYLYYEYYVEKFQFGWPTLEAA